MQRKQVVVLHGCVDNNLPRFTARVVEFEFEAVVICLI